MSKQPHEYSNAELRWFLSRQQPSHLDYPGLKFEWDRRQAQKTRILAALTLLVLVASLAVQYRASRVPSSSEQPTSPPASQLPLATTPTKHASAPSFSSPASSATPTTSPTPP